MYEPAIILGLFGVGGEIRWILTLFSEFLCTLFVMFGIFTRFTAAAPLFVMLVIALALPSGTGWSVCEMFLLSALPVLVLTFTGPGEYSVGGRFGAWANPR